MKKSIWISFLSLACVMVVDGVHAASEKQRERVRFERRNLSGPRFGMTWIPGSGDLVDRLDEHDTGNVLSQFGWHFEQQVVPEGGGPQLVVEFIPLVAGVEYGKLIPSATLALGVRFLNGIEIGLGPNVMVAGLESGEDIETAIVFGLGKTFDYSGVSVPLNIGIAHSPQGTRISFILGYSIARN